LRIGEIRAMESALLPENALPSREFLNEIPGFVRFDFTGKTACGLILPLGGKVHEPVGCHYAVCIGKGDQVSSGSPEPGVSCCIGTLDR